jgi:ADP-dependent NAD(P)H-hydrate dehydratase
MPSRIANSRNQRIKDPPALPPRPVDGHKGLFGRVLILGGNHDMIGAPVLAGLAALKMGSGLVQIALPKEVLPSAISIVPELIGLGLSRKADTVPLYMAGEKADVLVIGPGLGGSWIIGERIRALLFCGKPMVIDADGLNYLSALKTWPKTIRKSSAVLTPHPGEMGRLNKLLGRKTVPTDPEGRIELATFAAKSFGQTMVLKGHRTVVTDGRRVYVNQTGDSSLSKAGAGDILSGMLASLIGQGMSHFDAACAAVYLHGLAGELAGKRLGRRSVLARDVIENIPAAIGRRS